MTPPLPAREGDRVQVWNPGPHAIGTVVDATSDPDRVLVEWDYERLEGKPARTWAQRALLRVLEPDRAEACGRGICAKHDGHDGDCDY